MASDAYQDVGFPRLGGPVPLVSEEAGSKAAALSALLASGFRVPPGFVVTAAAPGGNRAGWEERLKAAARSVGPGPYAVRSSAAAEDLPGASYAGIYESYLGVAAEDLPAMVARCFESARTRRVAAYEAARGHQDRLPAPGAAAGTSAMAVLVQQMVDPAAAGVAFTANPMTGARDETVVSAVAGLGENLVASTVDGENWVVGVGGPRRSPGGFAVLSEHSATAVAEAAGRVAGHFGCPQDVEWALDRSGQIHILQARPMTALPDPVTWPRPGKGVWVRNFRLGEWLPEPVTPLFMDWIIPAIDAAYNAAVQRDAGVSIPMGHAAVNGWYYVAPPSPRALPHLLFGGSLRSLPYVFNAVVRPMFDPAGADHAVLRRLEDEWRTGQLQAYRNLVDAYAPARQDMALSGLLQVVEEVARHTGNYLWFFSVTGGAAWKMEMALARFWRRHLASALDGHGAAAGGYQVLLGGLLPSTPKRVPHAVYSLDWYFRTAGEDPLYGQDAANGVDPQAALPSAARRREAEAACRLVLRGSFRLARFDALLAAAQHYAVLREEQARDFTLGWPLLRRCAAGIGTLLQEAGIIADPDDVYFLTREDLRPDVPPRHAAVERRRREWLRQRKLDAPLTLGRLPLVGDMFDRIAGSARSTHAVPPEALVGHPASPGRARGKVRILGGPDDFAGFLPGGVLVAKATAPAWTPLFALAAAVVTDGGNLAAHASLVAREYGIPAVVGTGRATQVLYTGQPVIVDGSAGTVLPG
ncbi:PEP/pyruvate-binding domain-containing protein [Arthrobacter sp. C152]